MNLEPSQKKNQVVSPKEDLSMDDFDFKPVTAGLGFHHPKAADVKPIFTDRPVHNFVSHVHQTVKKDMNVYQNDLSLFYGQAATEDLVPAPVIKEEKVQRKATKGQRVLAYILDLLFITSILGIILTVMARTISMDLIEVWTMFPNEITPLVATLFCGFYLIYFSIFEKAPQTTFGKSLMGIKVTGYNRNPSFSTLFLRSLVSLANFVSLGLFSYFDLQSKVTNTKVIQAE